MNEDLILLIEKILEKNEKRISFTFKDLKPAIFFYIYSTNFRNCISNFDNIETV